MGQLEAISPATIFPGRKSPGVDVRGQSWVSVLEADS